ncbi:hypothetical protein ACFVR2_17585 [Gottfriedia sp. NPDC057991]|uniref:hypothetical protein n=1 Tax=Gottfriedia sp. NPDC057991 TaxID=3346298 RepID=UPI0036DEE394
MMKKLLKVSALSLAASTLLATIPAHAEENTSSENTSSQLSEEYQAPFSNPLEVTNMPISFVTDPDLPPPDEVVVGEGGMATTYTYVGSFTSTSHSYDIVSELTTRFTASFAAGLAVYKYLDSKVAGMAATAGAAAIFSTFYQKPTTVYYKTHMQVKDDGDGYMSTRKTVISYSDSARTKQTGSQTFYSTRFVYNPPN